MRCPVDNETLVMTDRNGVEIDYCPKCRGVWLDRGELDKIIERSNTNTTPVAAPIYQPEPGRSTAPPRQDPRRHHDDDNEPGRRHPQKRRESFQSDLSDF